MVVEFETIRDHRGLSILERRGGPFDSPTGWQWLEERNLEPCASALVPPASRHRETVEGHAASLPPFFDHDEKVRIREERSPGMSHFLARPSAQIEAPTRARISDGSVTAGTA